ncbi:olfactory receptor 4Q3-like [Hyla sarda]|uniref:olfactory receptor 4Q3-like n=1 Tax=Hyla sarda TaxID=327740 RepID=UPI0024C345DC|nr:olfactory receptor 4Q3-like [Hyla sarda]
MDEQDHGSEIDLLFKSLDNDLTIGIFKDSQSPFTIATDELFTIGAPVIKDSHFKESPLQILRDLPVQDIMSFYEYFLYLNQTIVREFILSSPTTIYELQTLLFFTFMFVFIITLVGNVLILLVIQLNTHLHTPMYTFLSHLSFLDLCYSSVTVPKLLNILCSSNRRISFYGCIAQIYFFHVLGSSEMFLLAVMAYDRFVAICVPLRYTILMRKKVCVALAGCAWFGGFAHSTFHTGFLLRLSFCGPNELDNFFCDATPLIKLACSDTTMDEILLIVTPAILGPFCFMLILVSYSSIVSSILKMNSREGRQKTFSTCASHLIVVSIFYGTGIVVYVQPMSVYTSVNRFITVFYAVITPMLNPLIYALRNKDVKGVLQKLLIQPNALQGKHNRISGIF